MTGVLKTDSFTVDLADPAAISNALAEVEHKVLEEREALRQVRERLNHWETLYGRLSALAGGRPDEAKIDRQSTRDRIVQIVEESDLPVDVERVMQLLPPGAKRKTVTWNLWDLERKHEIQRVTDGIYARLDYKPATLLQEQAS